MMYKQKKRGGAPFKTPIGNLLRKGWTKNILFEKNYSKNKTKSNINLF